jgi:hypothetical protein
MFLQTAQLLLVALPLPIGVLAVLIGDRFAWREFIIAFGVVASGYATLAFLVVFGSAGTWQDQFARWLRTNVVTHVWRVVAIDLILIACLGAETIILLRGPIIELSGQVLLDNRPLKHSATLHFIGVQQPFTTDDTGTFSVLLPDDRQSEFVALAEYGDLSGKRIVRRGGHRGFEIPLELRTLYPSGDQPSRSVGVAKRGVDGSASIRLETRTLANLSVLNAASPLELAFEVQALRHGAFTGALLEALSEKQLSRFDDIHRFISNRISDLQHPTLEGQAGALPVSKGQFNNGDDVFALSIGLTEYADSAIRPPLYATNDAVGFYSWLLNAGVPPGNAELLLNAHATKSAIAAYLATLAARVGSGSFVVLYYSGVGATGDDEDGQQDTVSEYVTCYDSRIAALKETALSAWQFQSLIKQLTSRGARVFLFLDTSFSRGTVTRQQ